MKQKLEDLKLLLKSDRRILIGGGALLLLLIASVVSITSTPSRTRRSSASVTDQPGANNIVGDPTEAYSDIVKSFVNEMEQTREITERNTKAIEQLATRQKDYESKTTGIFQTLVDKVTELDSELDKVAKAPKNAPAREEEPSDDRKVPDVVEKVGFKSTNVPPPPKKVEKVRMKVITPGDAVQLTLLTGVNAPVDGTPYPVVFRIDGPISGPDGSSLDVGSARLIAAATGSETDGRVLFRLTQLALRHQDGRRSAIPVDGWVIGEDGVRGMHGKLIDKLGRVIAATAGLSFAAELGQRLDERGNLTIVQPGGVFDLSADDYDAATATALSDAANRLGEALLDRYERLVPVVEVYSGRKVTAVFSSSAKIEELGNSSDEGIYAAALD